MQSKLIIFFVLLPSIVFGFISDNDIAVLQSELSGKPIGERIAFWAEKFMDTPYDTDPIGEYVRKGVIVADERVDCMYLTFRAVELGLSRTPSDSVQIALDKRFMTRGKMEGDRVVNYDERFQSGEDMLESGKWGKEITPEIGEISIVDFPHKGKSVSLVAGMNIIKTSRVLRSGDIIFFINSPHKKGSGEIVGHMGIVKKEGDTLYLIHASGIKNRGGRVKKVLLYDYIATMPFIGIKVSRFETGGRPSE